MVGNAQFEFPVTDEGHGLDRLVAAEHHAPSPILLVIPNLKLGRFTGLKGHFIGRPFLPGVVQHVADDLGFRCPNISNKDSSLVGEGVHNERITRFLRQTRSRR